MATGKTGAGKSALINGVIGKEVGEEGTGLDRMTVNVEPKRESLEGVEVTFWDTPGLQDGTDEEERYLEDMKKYCSDCHLYIYCVSMLQRRLDASEQRAIKKLTDTFGTDFWRKVLFVLTFANSERGLCPKGHDQVDWFKERVKMWHNAIAENLIACGVEQAVAESIVVVPAGYSQHLDDCPNPWILPGVPNWFHNFWNKCVDAVDERGIPALVKANLHRLRKPEDIVEGELKDYSIEDLPIPIGARVAKAGGLALAGTAAGAGAGAAVGAGVGAVVGTALGPAGTVVGALAGGALVTFVIDPIVVATYWRYSGRINPQESHGQTKAD